MKSLRSSRAVRATVLAASLGALFSVGSAMATTNLYGGGATFPAIPYTGSDYLNVLPNARLSTNATNNAGAGFTKSTINASSIFGKYSIQYPANHVSYCQTGSGFGKNALNAAATAPANGQCKDFSTSPAGFSGANLMPDFIGTDAPYSTTDYNNFLAGPALATHAGIVQIPSVAGAIALAVNGDLSTVALTNAQVCKIYSGKITSWSAIAGVTGSGHTGPIQIIYRTDGSGTTFAFTRYLAATCNGTANVPAGFVFTPNQTFNSALPGGVTAVYGTRAIGASGNNGVVATTLDAANTGAIGYADVGEVINQGAGYAKVAGFDPTKFGTDPATGNPKSLSISLAMLLTGKVLDGATVNDVPGSSDPAQKNCVRLVDPAFKVTATYPIVAVTYLAAYTTGTATGKVTPLKNLLNMVYNHTNRPVLPTGFAYIDGVGTFGTSVKNTVNSCIAP